MQAWMEGYESDIEYTTGYYREQEPDFLNLCAVTHGVEPINLEQGFTYCELGCGQGITALIMAANYPQGKFYAVDFNPSHIARARNLAAQAGLNNIFFLEKSFAQLAEDPTLLPECDFIVLHGIFTWVSDENRQHIINLCERHLKSGGMVYNSYNSKPGWSMGEPIQKMLFAATKLFSGNSLERLDKGIGMLKQFEEIGPRFFSVNKEVIKQRMDLLSSGNKNYLVHEYLHDGWRAFYFTEIANYMASAKLEFIGGAALTAAYVQGMMPEKANTFLRNIPDKNTRELFKDVALNTGFRKDIYMRGISSRLDQAGQTKLLHSTHWMLKKGVAADAAFTFKSPIGDVKGKDEVYRPIVNALARQSMSFNALVKELGRPVRDVVQALMFLCQEQIVTTTSDGTNVATAIRLNKVFISQLFGSNRIPYIALPLGRDSSSMSLPDMLFYAAVLNTGETESPETLVNYVQSEMESHGFEVKKNNVVLKGEELTVRLYEMEKAWRMNVLPVLRAFRAVG